MWRLRRQSALIHFPPSIWKPWRWGKPVIATCFGGSREQIIDGETGYIVNPFDTGAFAARLHELLTDESLRNQMGIRARAHIRDNFNLRRQIAAMTQIYERDAVMQAQAYREPGDLFRAQDAIMRWAKECGHGLLLPQGRYRTPRLQWRIQARPLRSLFLLAGRGQSGRLRHVDAQVADLRFAGRARSGSTAILHSQAMDFCEREMQNMAQRHQIELTRLPGRGGR